MYVVNYVALLIQTKNLQTSFILKQTPKLICKLVLQIEELFSWHKALIEWFSVRFKGMKSVTKQNLITSEIDGKGMERGCIVPLSS